MGTKRGVLLLIEDQRDLNEGLAETFTHEGYSVLQTFNGQEALDHLERGSEVDLIILDLLMPVKSGYELIFDIVSHPNRQLKNLPIIIMSARDEVESVAFSQKLPYVKKPFELDDLLRKIDIELKKRETDHVKH